MSLVLRFNVLKELDVVAGSCNPDTGEAETGKALLFPRSGQWAAPAFLRKKRWTRWTGPEGRHNLLSCGHHTYATHMYSCIDIYSTIIMRILASASFSSYLETFQQNSHHPTQPDSKYNNSLLTPEPVFTLIYWNVFHVLASFVFIFKATQAFQTLMKKKKWAGRLVRWLSRLRYLCTFHGTYIHTN